MSVKTQTFSCKLTDLIEDDKEMIIGYDSQNNEIYPTKIDDVLNDFSKSIESDGGAMIQLVPFFTEDTITVITFYTDTPPTTSNTLHIPK